MYKLFLGDSCRLHTSVCILICSAEYFIKESEVLFFKMQSLMRIDMQCIWKAAQSGI